MSYLRMVVVVKVVAALAEAVVECLVVVAQRQEMVAELILGAAVECLAAAHLHGMEEPELVVAANDSLDEQC